MSRHTTLPSCMQSSRCTLFRGQLCTIVRIDIPDRYIISVSTRIVTVNILLLPQFWPHFNNPLVLSGLRLTLEAETSTSGYQSVCLLLEPAAAAAATAGPQLGVQLVLCPSWPHLSVPVSNCVHLVDCVTRLAAGQLVL